MIKLRGAIALLLVVLVVGRPAPPVAACGPSYIEPIFIFKDSPDLPFEDFTNGNIGIVLPTFGRKTLVIAYRYLNGGSFSLDEQKELIKALKGLPPDGDQTQPLKQWIAARKEFVNTDEPTPSIYVERQHGGYDFFPNCTSNAFEVATETLRDRAARHGNDNKDVREWLEAQDTVFKNCLSGSHLPAELGMERPEWLRKDREYQQAAALFYSLELDDARERFAEIAADNNSPWQQTADYLVGRTLVRQASLTKDESKKRQFYQEAEVNLLGHVNKGGKFSEASKRLLSLVKYRLRPEERVRELARTLAFENGNTNLRQDLIDYVWLLDKFETRVLKEAAERQKVPDLKEELLGDKEIVKGYEAVQRGELVGLQIDPRTVGYGPPYVLYFEPDVSLSEVFAAYEIRLGRKLTPDEIKEITAAHASAVTHREWLLSPNRQLHSNDYEGGESGNLPLSLIPEFLLADDLSDWILTIQTDDPGSYDHAFQRWRETESNAWLIASLMKADQKSPGLERLVRAAQAVDRNTPTFAGSIYHLVRLKSDAGKKAEARELLDQVFKSGVDHLPVSAQNLFAEQRMNLAEDLNNFLRSGLRTPVGFYDDGRLVSRLKFFEAPSGEDESEFHRFRLPQEFESNALPEDVKNELQQQAEAEFQKLLAWKDRMFLDPKVTEILNTHFTLPALIDVLRSPALPDYLRERIALAIWTRAIVLERQQVADKIAPAILNFAPEMGPFLLPYLRARTAREKERAALFLLLKNPQISPLIADGLPTSFEPHDFSYYYQSAWWCAPSLTEYNMEGEEVAKEIPVPNFVSSGQVADSRKDYLGLIEIDDAKSYLGKRALEWAKAAPDDARIPEALFIAAKANSQYKYGCSGWEHDKKTKTEAETLLRTRYPNSPWTAKLRDEE